MGAVDQATRVAFDCTNCCSHLETCLRGFLVGQAGARDLCLWFVQLYLLRNLRQNSR
jgi:hypothetical protein